MQFIKRDDYHAISECGLYCINRANIPGGGAYMAVRLGKPWLSRSPNGDPAGWDGSVILTTARYASDDQASRVAAYGACVAACEADAAPG